MLYHFSDFSNKDCYQNRYLLQVIIGLATQIAQRGIVQQKKYTPSKRYSLSTCSIKQFRRKALLPLCKLVIEYKNQRHNSCVISTFKAVSISSY